MKGILLCAALLLATGCGLHIVKYDPSTAAVLSEKIAEDFAVYNDNVPTATADVTELGQHLRKNLPALAELLRTK